MTFSRANVATSGRSVDRFRGETDRSRAELSLLCEALRIKDSRLSRIAPRRRPHYRPTQRMAILELKAARGWSIEETAQWFLVEPATTAEWMRRVNEQDGRALVQTDEPVNRFPDSVCWMVRRLKVLCPTFGKKRIAQILSRAGIHLGATTVGRMLKEREKPKPPVEDAVEPETRSKSKPVVATNRATPKYVLSDKGRQFDCRAFKAWCDRKGIQPRYASTGKQTRATAIVERFVRSAKCWLS